MTTTNSYPNSVPVLTRAVFSSMVLGLTSCAVEQAPPEDLAGQAQQDLIAYRAGTWTRWPNTVNICFVNYVGSYTVGENVYYHPGWDLDTYGRGKTTVMTVLNDTWHAASALNFVNNGDCSTYDAATSSSWLHIVLDYNSGSCGIGVGTTCNIGMWDLAAGDPRTILSGTVHEVGHALGLEHEHQSPANPGPICTEEQIKLDACVKCRAEWDRYLAGHPTLPSCTIEQNSACDNVFANVQKDPAAAVFTPYDPESIMNYCSLAPRADRHDYSLTEYDKLGIEIIYPRSRTRSLVSWAAPFTVNGSVVRRSDDLVMTDWSFRGALPGVFGNGIQWRVDSVKHTIGTSLALSSLSAGEHTVSGTFTDIFGRAQRTTTEKLNFNLDTSLHTALTIGSSATL